MTVTPCLNTVLYVNTKLLVGFSSYDIRIQNGHIVVTFTAVPPFGAFSFLSASPEAAGAVNNTFNEIMFNQRDYFTHCEVHKTHHGCS